MFAKEFSFSKVSNPFEVVVKMKCIWKSAFWGCTRMKYAIFIQIKYMYVSGLWISI